MPLHVSVKSVIFMLPLTTKSKGGPRFAKSLSELGYIFMISPFMLLISNPTSSCSFGRHLPQVLGQKPAAIQGSLQKPSEEATLQLVTFSSASKSEEMSAREISLQFCSKWSRGMFPKKTKSLGSTSATPPFCCVLMNSIASFLGAKRVTLPIVLSASVMPADVEAVSRKALRPRFCASSYRLPCPSCLQRFLYGRISLLTMSSSPEEK